MPVADRWRVVAVFFDVAAVVDELIAEGLFGVRADGGQARDAIDHVDGQVEAIQIVAHDHVEGGGGRALFLVAADVQVGVIGAPVGEPMNQPGIAVVGEDDRLVGREERVEIAVGQPVRMLFGRAAAASDRPR